MLRDTSVNIDRMCEGMSSGPSSLCVNWGWPSGTVRSIQASRSRRAEGSAFSWITREADVCCTKSTHTPSCTPVDVTAACTWSVIS